MPENEQAQILASVNKYSHLYSPRLKGLLDKRTKRLLDKVFTGDLKQVLREINRQSSNAIVVDIIPTKLFHSYLIVDRDAKRSLEVRIRGRKFALKSTRLVGKLHYVIVPERGTIDDFSVKYTNKKPRPISRLYLFRKYVSRIPGTKRFYSFLKRIKQTRRKNIRNKSLDFIGHILAKFSDKLYLKTVFYKRFRRWPKTNPPRSFNEHILCYKLENANNITFQKLADKIEAKHIVASKIGKDYILPTLWYGDDSKNIPFEELSNTPYVIKSAHGWNQNIFVNDPNLVNKNEIIKKANSWLNKSHGYKHREMHYKMIPRRILIEPMMVLRDGAALNDYKFWCFSGVVKFVQIDVGRRRDHHRAIVDSRWKPVNFRKGKKKLLKNPIKPKNFDEMLRVAETLSVDFEFVRIDLYNIDGRILFGEYTFTPAAGVSPFIPDEADFYVGKYWPKKATVT